MSPIMANVQLNSCSSAVQIPVTRLRFHWFSMVSNVIHSCILLLFLTNVLFGQGVQSLHLTGVTVMPDHPRADVYASFFHELISEISEVADFSYNLRQLPDHTKHGGDVGESEPQGIIGEVYHGRADFVIANLEITPERKRFVEFTRPFMRSQLAALIPRSSPALTAVKPSPISITNNSQETEQEEMPVRTLRTVLQKSKRIVIGGSNVDHFFRTSKNPQVYHLLPSTTQNFQTAMNLLGKSSDYALISDSARLELIAASQCPYRVITANGGHALSPNSTLANADSDSLNRTVDFAIGLKLNSPFKGQFESALRYLDQSGRLDGLISQHWVNYCNDNNNPEYYGDYEEDGQNKDEDDDDALRESQRLAEKEVETNGAVIGHFPSILPSLIGLTSLVSLTSTIHL